MIGYEKKIDEAKFMSILIKDDQLLKKCIQICVKMGYYMEKEFYSKPVHNEKYIKNKIKSYNGKSNTDLHDN